MPRLLQTVLLSFLLSCGGRDSPSHPQVDRSGRQHLIAAVRAALHSSTGIEVLFLDSTHGPPAPGPNRFHNWPIVQRALVPSGPQLSQLSEALARDLSLDDPTLPRPCENLPSYGIRVTGGTQSADLVLDYVCHIADAYRAGTESGLGAHRVDGSSYTLLESLRPRLQSPKGPGA